jgi:hypothetical protein
MTGEDMAFAWPGKKAVGSPVVTVEFLRHCDIYNAGEKAGFPAARAAQLVMAGVAVVIAPPPTTPIEEKAIQPLAEVSIPSSERPVVTQRVAKYPPDKRP